MLDLTLLTRLTHLTLPTSKAELANPTGKGKGGGRSSRFGEPPAELGLSDAQKAKWTEAAASLRKKLDAARSSGGGPGAFGEAIGEFRNEVKGFLTAEQVEQMEKVFAGRRGEKK